MPGPRQTVSDIPNAPRDKNLRMTCARCGERSSFRKWASDHRWCRSCGLWVHKACAVHVMGKPHCPVCRGTTRKLFKPLISAIAVLVLLLGVILVVSSVPNVIERKMMVDLQRAYATEVDARPVDDLVRVVGTVTCPGSNQNCTPVTIKEGEGSYLSGDMRTEIIVSDFSICDETGCIQVWPETVKIMGMGGAVYAGTHGGDYKGGDEVVLIGKVMKGQGGINVLRLRTIAPKMDDIRNDLYMQVSVVIIGIMVMGVAVAVIAKQVSGLSALDRHERYVRFMHVTSRVEAPSRPPGWKGVYHEGGGEGEGEGTEEGKVGADRGAGEGGNGSLGGGNDEGGPGPGMGGSG